MRIVMSVISKKICLVGDFGVGKTSLIRRFVDRQFSDKYLSTVGVKISRKVVDLMNTDPDNKKELQLLIWDIEGSNKFKAIAPTYFQGARGAIIVADVTQQETLTSINSHIQSFLLVNPQASIVIALNKSDLIEAEYLEEIRQKYQCNSNSHVLSTFITSAKTGNNVDEMFQLLSHALVLI
jgi:small GTP-binding protein